MQEKMDLKPYIAGIAFSVIVGFSFLGIKVAIPYGSPLEILTHRYNFAFLSVILIAVFRFGKIHLKKKPKGAVVITGLSYILFMIFQTTGLVYSTSVEGAIIFAVAPILVQVLAGIFLKEKATALQNIFVVLVVGALIYMILMGAGTLTFSFLGTILLLLASLSMAVNSVMMRYVREAYTPFEITAVTAFFGFIAFNGIALISGVAKGDFFSYIAPLFYPEFILATVYLGAFCLTMSLLLMAYMQANMPAVNAAIFGNVSTAISIVAGAFILGEEIRYYHILCSVIIVGGVIGNNATGARRKNKNGKRKYKTS